MQANNENNTNYYNKVNEKGIYDTDLSMNSDLNISRGISNIQSLDIRKQEITNIRDISDFVELEYAYLLENRIRSLENVIFPSKLLYVNLMFNHIETLENVVFPSKIKYLLLAFNQNPKTPKPHFLCN